MGFAGFGIAAEGDLSFLGVHDLGVSADRLPGRPDAGEDEIGTANAFFLQTVHPVGDAVRQFAEYLAPVADRASSGRGRQTR